MELHPILEKDIVPNPDLWYVLSAYGEFPAERVGHTCSYIPSEEDGTNGKVYVIGGANPGGTHSATHVLDLESFTWEIVDCPHPSPRYEHTAIIPSTHPDRVIVFGGADRQKNFNDILRFDCKSQKWVGNVVTSGNPPAPRTYHTNSACCGDKLVIYGGGQAGTEPIGDRQVRVLDLISNQWTSLNAKGEPPKPRHGHVIVAHGNKVYIHGGMGGSHLYDDLHVLDLEKNSWTAYKSKKSWPSGRASHGGAIADGHLFIFGGMTREGAVDDLWKMDLDTMRWTLCKLSGPAPANRLDFAMCVVRLKVPETTTSQCTDDIVGSSLHAQEVIMRSGSASSAGSRSSAGSQRSTANPTIVDLTPANLAGPGTTPPSTFEGVLQDDPGASANVEATESVAETVEGPCKVVEMLLVLGGMDTEGEFFDDCLLYLVNEYPHPASKDEADEDEAVTEDNKPTDNNEPSE